MLASRGVPDRVAVLAPAVCETDSHDGQVVHEMVHESLESLSSSEVVMLYEYAASSVPVVVPVLEMLGASLVLATTIVNVSVTEAVPSLAVMTTLLSPTLASSGVPVSTPVEAVKVAQDGTVVPVRVTVSPESASEVVTVYVYAVSSVAAVTAVLVIVGASLALATAIVND